VPEARFTISHFLDKLASDNPMSDLLDVKADLVDRDEPLPKDDDAFT
jgi:hypothetical protein